MQTTSEMLHVALIGNPNSGKSTLFNALTGLKQRTGNFPGVTVEKLSGRARLSQGPGKPSQTVNFIDLPGTYSLFPKSPDEEESLLALLDTQQPDAPDLVLVVLDASNLDRSLLLATQVIDAELPTALVVNMMDLLDHSGYTLDLERMSQELKVPVFGLSAREKTGLHALRLFLASYHPSQSEITPYYRFLLEHNYHWLRGRLPASVLGKGPEADLNDPMGWQSRDSLERFRRIDALLKHCRSHHDPVKAFSLTAKIDDVVTHPVWGFLVFLGVLLLIFQAIFSWSAIPMDWIDSGFAELGSWLERTLPQGSFSDLIAKGVIPGLGGIFMFIPQIAILFAFIALLEDSGYMARVSFIMDRLLRRFGINGKSIIPLISGVACAVPAILSARTIKNTRERLLTIFITPLMSCSARLPVYTLLVAVAVPETESGMFNTRGLILLGLYMMGFLAALLTALLMKFWVKSRERSIFIMELPVYRMPQGRVVFSAMFEKVKVFVVDAGKIIVAISVVLWMLSSYSLPGRFEALEKHYQSEAVIQQLGAEQAKQTLESEKLRNSYAGILGRTIEPVIQPLGFDWKIGIALVTSLAAREVFVGTMATIYSAGDADEESVALRDIMRNDTWHGTPKPLFSFATSMALMVFYAFAMQCISTLAVVKRETGSWKWPLLQFFWFGALAWVSAFLVQIWLG